MTLNLIVAPVTLVVVDTIAVYNAITKKTEIDDDNDRATAGMVHRNVVDDKVIVYIDITQNPDEVIASIVHESVHVYRLIREYMGIGYDDEIAAYGIESIYRELLRQIKLLCQSKGISS